MRERSFDEMIVYFNRRVSEMDIAQDYKMELLGMVTALEYKHEKTAQQWIPCSERLPDMYRTYYLVSLTDKKEVDIAYFTEYGTWETFRNDEVEAWTPLPEPWRGEEHETD